jgi:hypothetical protein
MLTTRRRRKKGQRQLAVIAKRAKKLWNQNAKMGSADASTKEPA